ncbi:MAG: hypothetical protein ACNA77_08515 [Opitutales bacterium]
MNNTKEMRHALSVFMGRLSMGSALLFGATSLSFGEVVFIGKMCYNPPDDPVSLTMQGSNWNTQSDFIDISWSVYQNPGTGLTTATTQPSGYDWYYEYVITVNAFTPQTFLLEVGQGAATGDFSNFLVQKSNPGSNNTVNTNTALGTFTDVTITNLPQATYGLQFSDMGGAERSNTADVTTISFWSTKAPGWGDFFTNCGGGGNRAWNIGFTDPSPTAAAADGSLSGHLLTPIPEPGAFSLMLLSALLCLGARHIL